MNINLKTKYQIPERLAHKYKGCGNGIAVINKHTQEVMDIHYTDADLKIRNTQNAEMTKEAGNVIFQDDKAVTYRANFSCWEVLLF